MSAKEIYGEAAWYTWPEELASKNQRAIDTFQKKYPEKIEYYYFEQYVFHRQWQKLKSYASEKDILLFGDLPIYVSYDSVDVWAHQEIFCLDPKTHKPTHVAGVPPDYFSKTGQRWGNPLYDWHNSDPEIHYKLLQWWKKRLTHLFKQVDTVRIDHFRAFESYWAIPEENSYSRFIDPSTIQTTLQTVSSVALVNFIGARAFSCGFSQDEVFLSSN